MLIAPNVVNYNHSRKNGNESVGEDLPPNETLTEQTPDQLLLVDRCAQIARHYRHVGEPGRVADFGQRQALSEQNPFADFGARVQSCEASPTRFSPYFTYVPANQLPDAAASATANQRQPAQAKQCERGGFGNGERVHRDRYIVVPHRRSLIGDGPVGRAEL